MTFPDGTPTVGVDLARQVGVLWGAIGQLADRIDQLTAKET